MHLGAIETRTSKAIIAAQETGLVAGTTVLTLQGEMTVDQLSIGDRVITRDSGITMLKDIKTRTVKMSAICVKARSLGHTRPDRDMLVSPGTRLHIRDWRSEAMFGTPTAMVAAHKLVDGEFLAAQPAAETDVFELVFDRPHIVYADGMEMLIG